MNVRLCDSVSAVHGCCSQFLLSPHSDVEVASLGKVSRSSQNSIHAAPGASHSPLANAKPNRQDKLVDGAPRLASTAKSGAFWDKSPSKFSQD